MHAPSILMFALGIYAIASIFIHQLPATWPRRLRKGEPVGIAGRITAAAGFLVFGVMLSDSFRFSRGTHLTICSVVIAVTLVAWWYDVHRAKNFKPKPFTLPTSHPRQR